MTTASGDSAAAAALSSPKQQTAHSEDTLPIRSSADYDDDDDDDDDDELVYAAETSSSSRGKHRATPSTSRLLPDDDSAEQRRRAELRADFDAELLGSEGQSRNRWTQAKRLFDQNHGFLLIAAAQGFFASMSVCVKILQEDMAVPVWEIILVRMSVTWLGCYWYMRLTRVEHPLLGPPQIRRLLAWRGLIGFFGLAPSMYALKYLSLSDATVLTFLTPVLVGGLAALFLSERWSVTEALTGVTSLFGVILIAKPTFLFPPAIAGPTEDTVTPEERTKAVGVALMGTFGAAGAYLLIRLIGKRANALHSISYFAAGSCVIALVFPLITHSPPVFHLTLRFFALVVPIGIFGFVAQALLTMGLQREKAGRGTLAVYTNLLFAMVFERLIFGRYPDLWSLLGASIIVGGAVRVALEKTKSSVAMSTSDSRGKVESEPLAAVQVQAGDEAGAAR